jgi:hypothetical protein
LVIQPDRGTKSSFVLLPPAEGEQQPEALHSEVSVLLDFILLTKMETVEPENKLSPSPKKVIKNGCCNVIKCNSLCIRK